MARKKIDKDGEEHYKGISRIDSKDTHGWNARVYFKGKSYSKLFSDNLWEIKKKSNWENRELTESWL